MPEEEGGLCSVYFSLALILGFSVYLFESMPYRGAPIYAQESSQVVSVANQKDNNSKGLELVVNDLEASERHEEGLASR